MRRAAAAAAAAEAMWKLCYRRAELDKAEELHLFWRASGSFGT
jgi:hypothetical protein